MLLPSTPRCQRSLLAISPAAMPSSRSPPSSRCPATKPLPAPPLPCLGLRPVRSTAATPVGTPADQPAAAEGAAPRKGEAVKEADAAEGAGAGTRKEGADQEEEEGGGSGAHVNKATGEIGGPCSFGRCRTDHGDSLDQHAQCEL